MSRNGPRPAPAGAFRCPVQVRWRDLDPFDHVNNAAVVSYLEIGRVALWRRRFPGRDVPFVVARLELDFRRPILLEDEVAVVVWASAVGRSSFTFRYRVEAGGAVVAAAETVQVHLGPDGRPAPLPPAIREGLGAERHDG